MLVRADDELGSRSCWASIVIFTGGSVVRTLVMTRQARSRLTLPVDILIRRLVSTIARRFQTICDETNPELGSTSDDRRSTRDLVDQFHRLHADVAWRCRSAARLLVSRGGFEPFTLGFASSDREQLSIIDFIAAATGPITIGLMISYPQLCIRRSTAAKLRWHS